MKQKAREQQGQVIWNWHLIKAWQNALNRHWKYLLFHKLGRFFRENFKQEVCNVIYIFIFRSNNCIFRTFSVIKHDIKMNMIKGICTTLRMWPLFFPFYCCCWKFNTAQLTIKHHLLWFASCSLLKVAVELPLLLLCMWRLRLNTGRVLDKWEYMCNMTNN